MPSASSSAQTRSAELASSPPLKSARRASRSARWLTTCFAFLGRFARRSRRSAQTSSDGAPSCAQSAGDAASASPKTRATAEPAEVSRQGPVYEVQITLVPASTPSGYEWTVGEGPPSAPPITSIGVASIETSRQSIASQIFG